ncbi:hypothetical protein ACWF62_17535 [Rhodococcus sp. NPDC054953]
MNEPTAEPADTAEQVSGERPPPITPQYKLLPVVAYIRYPCCSTVGPRRDEHVCPPPDEGEE